MIENDVIGVRTGLAGPGGIHVRVFQHFGLLIEGHVVNDNLAVEHQASLAHEFGITSVLSSEMDSTRSLVGAPWKMLARSSEVEDVLASSGYHFISGFGLPDEKASTMAMAPRTGVVPISGTLI